MKRISLSLLLLIAAATAYCQSTWTIDKSHSKIGFSVTHMAVAETEGNFKDFDATINSATEDFSGAEVTFTARAASIDTENERRDNHLKSADFFDVEKFPELSFRGNLYKDGGKYKLKGDLTLRGVTRQVEFDVTYGGSINTGRGYKAGFKLSGQINRRDFGLTWDRSVPSGELVVGDIVDIICKIEVDKAA